MDDMGSRRAQALAALGKLMASLRANAGLAALSLALATLLWFFTGGEQDDLKRGIIPDLEVPVQPVNLPEGLALASELPRVQVRAQAAADVWDKLTPDDFRAFVVLSGLGEGKHLVPVQLEPRTSRGGLRVLGAVPAELTVELVPLFTKTVPVEAMVTGEPAPGLAPSLPQVTPSEVMVAGPRDLVSLVAKALARVDIRGATAEVLRAVPLEPQDRLGVVVRGVSLQPSIATVTVPIRRAEVGRLVPVEPRLKGTPAPGYNVEEVIAEPAVMVISGPEETVASLNSLQTETVDISDAREDVTATVRLRLPSGVSVQGDARVRVTVRIRPAQAQATFGVVPAPRGLAPELTVRGLPPLVQVTIAGPLPLLRTILPQQISAQVALQGLGPGTYRLPIIVLPPQGTTLVAVTPAEVEVTITRP
jgi:YbbR domain-containing protein